MTRWHDSPTTDHDAEILALRLELAALRNDPLFFAAAWCDLLNDHNRGKSNLLYQVVDILAHHAACSQLGEASAEALLDINVQPADRDHDRGDEFYDNLAAQTRNDVVASLENHIAKLLVVDP